MHNFFSKLTPITFALIVLSCTKDSAQRETAGFVKNSALPLEESSDGQAAGRYNTIEWTDLIPQDDLDALLDPPEYLDEIEDGSPEDDLASDIRTAPASITGRYEEALVSQRIKPEFDKQRIRIPGFIVPLEYNEMQTITTFFLVPFFGACIHYPPPPPNQIIYAEFEPGIQLEALYDPYWIEGTLFTKLIENDMATAAYTMQVDRIEEYEDQPVADLP